jgi:hypothetical protein
VVQPPLSSSFTLLFLSSSYHILDAVAQHTRRFKCFGLLLQGVLAVAEACGMQNLLKAAGVEYQVHHSQFAFGVKQQACWPAVGIFVAPCRASTLATHSCNICFMVVPSAGLAQAAAADQLRHRPVGKP